MLNQTLPFFGVDVNKFSFLERLLKGCYNFNPPRPRYTKMWDVQTVLTFVFNLYPLEDLSLKNLTLKLVTLVALTTAGRSQTLSALDLRYVDFLDSNKKVVFSIQQILKTSRPGQVLPNVVLVGYDKPELCVVKTLLCYVNVTKKVRKSSRLFISYMTYKTVTTSTLARWIKLFCQWRE